MLASISKDGLMLLWDLRPLCLDLLVTNEKTKMRGNTPSARMPVLCCAIKASDGIPISCDGVCPTASHSNVFLNVNWSNDGKFLLACTSDGDREAVIYCWIVRELNHTDPATTLQLELLSTIRHHDCPAGSAHFVPQFAHDVPEAIWSSNNGGPLNSLSFESMKNLLLVVSTGESDDTMLLCDAHTGTSLAELSEVGSFVDAAILPARSAVVRFTDDNEVVHIAGLVLYVTAEKTIKVCRIELCRLKPSDANFSGDDTRSIFHGEDAEVSYYYRFVPAAALELPCPVMSIGMDCGRRSAVNNNCVVCFSGDRGCALMSVSVSLCCLNDDIVEIAYLYLLVICSIMT